jgi:hypothetical protein
MPTLPDRLRSAAQALLGLPQSTAPITGLRADDPAVERLRELQGGQIQPLPQTLTRVFQADVEEAIKLADRGNLQKVGQLWRAMRRDGDIAGLLKTRTSGLVALPRRWRGDPVIIDALKAENGTRSVFDEMCPPSEQALLAADGIGPGIGVAELVEVPGRSHPVMVRLDPEFLTYRWNEGRWYFRSTAGLLPITPGDGRWVLHTPGGILTPWQWGQWQALSRAFIDKEHALLHRSNFSGKLANPARVAFAANGATEDQRRGFLAALIAWGVNTVFELPPGWDTKLLESNGRGWEVFRQQVEDANHEIMIALAGQIVTVTGGSGFANAGIHETIRADLIKETADALAHTLNTQVIPPWELRVFGREALANTARVEWDIAPPVDRKAEAESMKGAADSVSSLRRVAAAAGLNLDVEEVFRRFGIPLRADRVVPEVIELPPEAAEGDSGPAGAAAPAKPPTKKASTDDDPDDDDE